MTSIVETSATGASEQPARADDAAHQARRGHVRAFAGLAGMLVAEVRSLVAGASDRGRMQRDAAIAFGVRVSSAGLLYVTQIALARWMGSFDYGIYVFVWTWVLILGALSHCGLNLICIRMVPSYREAGDFARLNGLMRGARLAALGCGTLVMLAGIAGIWLLQSHIESYFVLPAYLAMVCVPLYALTDVQDGLGRGNAWMSEALLAPYILRPLILLATMAAAHAAGFEMAAPTAAGAAIVATWGAGLVQTLLINRRAHATLPAVEARIYDVRAWFKSAVPLIIILASELLMQNTDVIAISHFLSPSDAGIYFAAGKTMALIMFVHYAVSSAVAHKFAALDARGDQEALRAFVRDAVNWTFWPSLAGALFILLIGKPLLWLFGPQFEVGYPVMCILVVGFLFRSAMGPAEYLLNMLGEQVLCAGVLLAAAMLNIALNMALVPTLGLIGAATATSLSLVFVALLSSLAVRRRLGIEIAIWNGWKAWKAQRSEAQK